MFTEESPRISSSYEASLPFTYWGPVHYQCVAVTLVCSGEIGKDGFECSIFYCWKLNKKKEALAFCHVIDIYAYITELSAHYWEVAWQYDTPFAKYTWLLDKWDHPPPFFHSHYLLFSGCTKPKVQYVCVLPVERTDCALFAGTLVSHKTWEVPLFHTGKPLVKNWFHCV